MFPLKHPFRVQPGEPISARRTNEWRDYVLGTQIGRASDGNVHGGRFGRVIIVDYADAVYAAIADISLPAHSHTDAWDGGYSNNGFAGPP